MSESYRINVTLDGEYGARLARLALDRGRLFGHNRSHPVAVPWGAALSSSAGLSDFRLPASHRSQRRQVLTLVVEAVAAGT